jgi:AcrR family transcriptional regulator
LVQKSKGQEDLRVRRTRQALRQALFDLTIEKGFNAVTVRALAERAMVNRSTFYRHYLDIDDLLDHYLDELQAQAAEAAASAEQAGQPAPDEVPAGLLLLVRHVQEHGDFYRVMLGPQGNPKFTHRFRQLTEKRYRDLFSRFPTADDPHHPPNDMRINYISHASVGSFLWWLEKGQATVSAEQFAIWLGQLHMTSAGLTDRL